MIGLLSCAGNPSRVVNQITPSPIGELPTQDALNAIAVTLGTGLILGRTNPFIAALMTVSKDIMLVSDINLLLPAIDFLAIGFKISAHNSKRRKYKIEI